MTLRHRKTYLPTMRAPLAMAPHHFRKGLRGRLIASASVLLLSCSVGMAADPAPSATPVPGKGPPDVAALRMVDENGQPSKLFLERYHEPFLKRGKEGPIGVLFIGDSITAGWLSAGKEIWKKYYGAYNPANFGVGGDRTQGVLWRIEHGELDGISPKVVVLLIGVNNGGDPAVVRGVRKVVEEIRAKLPDSKILLLGIFPRGNDPANPPWNAKSRTFTAQVNKELSTIADGKNVRFLDIGDKFLDAQGFISKDIMPDGLHPGPAGYQIWADAMQPLLTEMLGDEK